MKLSVATNFDNNFLDDISQYPVDEIYGKLPKDIVGGGRASYTTGTADMKQLTTHIETAHKNGIKFNYLLNASCMGNREWSRKGIKQIHKLLDELATIGVDSLTVSTPYLAEVIKKHYPNFKLKVGIYANIDTPIRAKFWEDLGADMLVIESFSINRKFELLKAIRKSVKCELQLIANFSCLPNCPMQVYHMNGISHGSNDHDKAPFIDYCVLKCSSFMLATPSLLLKSNWIRPEDLSFYEELGFDNFKLLERNAPSDIMLKRVKSYSERVSPDNLLDLIQPYGFQKNMKMKYGWIFRMLFEKPRLILPLYKLLKTRGMLFPLKGEPVVLSSKDIPADFLNEVAKRPCTSISSCETCNYCETISEKAYSIEPAFHEKCTRLYEKVFSLLS